MSDLGMFIVQGVLLAPCIQMCHRCMVTANRDDFCLPCSHVLQDNFAKAMMPMFDFVSICRSGAVQLVQGMEAVGGSKLGPYVFKCLEGVRDPSDFHELLRTMGNKNIKPTGVRLKAEVTRILRAR